MKKALITGITGQDGYYLARHLLDNGYQVFGLLRRSSTDPLLRIENLVASNEIELIYGNLRDSENIKRVMKEVVPDEIYNLAAMSDVGISFKCPEESWDVNFEGVRRIVDEALAVNPQVRIYQASTSEMFGSSPPPQDENTPFQPVSPYAEAKLKAHEEIVKKYREKGVFICSGILFNHESPLRGTNFVTRKITKALARIKLGTQQVLELGNLDATRDWGYAGDYVRAMHLMLQQEIPDDFVIATGQTQTVRDFVNAAAKAMDILLTWEGVGEDEIARNGKGNIVVRVNPKYYRPNEVESLLGNPQKAVAALGWEQKVSFEELVAMMTTSDYEIERNKAR